MATEVVKLSRIRTDFGTQLRAFTRQDIIDDYAEMMKNGEKFPPVDVFEHGRVVILADGFKRVAAAEKNGLKEIDCRMHNGGPVQALIFAAGANSKHGERRSREDKIKAVKALLAEPDVADKSDRAIAEMANVSNTFVSALRADMEKTKEKQTGKPTERKPRVGRDGKRRKQPKKATATGEGTEGTQGAAAFDLKAFNATVGAVARHLDDIARDFGLVHAKNGTIKESIEHKGIRRKLEEVGKDVVAWIKQLEKQKKDANKGT